MGLLNGDERNELRAYFTRYPAFWPGRTRSVEWYLSQIALYRILFVVAILFTLCGAGLLVAFWYIFSKNQFLAEAEAEGIPSPKALLKNVRQARARQVTRQVEANRNRSSSVTGQEEPILAAS